MRFDNSEIKDTGGLLDPGAHVVHVTDIRTEEFSNRNGERRNKAVVIFKNSEGKSHWEDFLLLDTCLWKLKQLSVACGISKDAKWSFEDIMGKQCRIHIKKRTYKRKDTGETGEKTEIYKFEQASSQNADNGFTDPQVPMDDPEGFGDPF